MTSKQLILVTGASGFLGAQIVDHLLTAGYAVRGTSRSGKIKSLLSTNTNPDFQAVVIDDLTKDDFSAALDGVSGVVHNASPLPASDDDHIQVALEGTLNLLHQAYAAKVYKFTLVSSVVTLNNSFKDYFNGSVVLKDQDWITATREEVSRPGAHPFMVYAVSKALGEHAAWEFAESHPEVDLTTILPPSIYGPISPRQVVTSTSMLSSNQSVYALIARPTPSYPPLAPPQAVDVRDVAKAITLSLKTQPAKQGERKRVPLSGGNFTWKQAVRHLAAVRPEWKTRLVDGGQVQGEDVVSMATIDTSRAKELLGINKFIPWQQSIEDAIESMLKKEDAWVPSS